MAYARERETRASRCPNTASECKVLLDNNESEGAGEDTFLVATCLTCGSAHFVNPRRARRAANKGVPIEAHRLISCIEWGFHHARCGQEFRNDPKRI
jgi:hypothetical protein